MTESAPRRFFLLKSDPRDDQQIDAEVEDELTFHIQQLTRELVEAGQSDDEAKVDALTRFGDVNKIKTQCKRIALEERIMLQRINFILTIVVLLAVTFVSVEMYFTQKHNTVVLQAIGADLADMKTVAGSPPRAPGVVYIVGDIRRPGVYAVRPDGRLMLSQLMFSAGLDALPVDVNVRRKIDGEETIIWSGSFATIQDLGRGLAVAAEDLVTITTSPSRSSIGFIQVDGDIPHPARYGFLLSEPLTVSQFFASAGGSDRDALHLGVIRAVGQTPRKVFDRLVDDLSDLAEDDLDLRPDDFVIVAAANDLQTRSDE